MVLETFYILSKCLLSSAPDLMAVRKKTSHSEATQEKMFDYARGSEGQGPGFGSLSMHRALWACLFPYDSASTSLNQPQHHGCHVAWCL